MNRRRFLVATGGGIAALGLGTASALAVTDDDLAVANFGLPAEWLLQDIHGQVIAARLGTRSQLKVSRQARSFAAQHATALAALLQGADQTLPVRDDFDFALPKGAFASRERADGLARRVTFAVRGAFLAAAATSSDDSYRALFASLAAGHSTELVSLGAPPEPFPVALDLESASTAIEEYLG